MAHSVTDFHPGRTAEGASARGLVHPLLIDRFSDAFARQESAPRPPAQTGGTREDERLTPEERREKAEGYAARRWRC